MKKILVYINPERYSSLFDIIVAYDAGVDAVVHYLNASIDEIRDTVYGCAFTRGGDDLKNTAIFIGGSDVNQGEEFMERVLEVFDELPKDLRVSVFADPHGAYTASSACVIKIKNRFEGKLSNLSATVLAGTGPVGQIVSALLAKEGCNVRITSRKKEKAERIAEIVKKKYGVKVEPFEADDEESFEKAVSDADIVVSTGPEGRLLLPRKTWSKAEKIKVLADLNAVEPYGIEGISAGDDCREIAEGKAAIGPFAIGKLKIKTHRRIVAKMFEEKGVVYGVDEIYKAAGGISAAKKK